MQATTLQPLDQAKRRRALSSGIQLSDEDASRILGMHLRGDRQHDIAAFHGVDSARVSEVIHGRKFKGAEAMARHLLPPPGPYALVVRASVEQLKAELATRSF